VAATQSWFLIGPVPPTAVAGAVAVSLLSAVWVEKSQGTESRHG
jgi:hypothetical protein